MKQGSDRGPMLAHPPEGCVPARSVLPPARGVIASFAARHRSVASVKIKPYEVFVDFK
jgi:hypothetical protein